MILDDIIIKNEDENKELQSRPVYAGRTEGDSDRKLKKRDFIMNFPQYHMRNC